jgi:hypothetical protein
MGLNEMLSKFSDSSISKDDAKDIVDTVSIDRILSKIEMDASDLLESAGFSFRNTKIKTLLRYLDPEESYGDSLLYVTLLPEITNSNICNYLYLDLLKLSLEYNKLRKSGK